MHAAPHVSDFFSNCFTFRIKTQGHVEERSNPGTDKSRWLGNTQSPSRRTRNELQPCLNRISTCTLSLSHLSRVFFQFHFTTYSPYVRFSPQCECYRVYQLVCANSQGYGDQNIALMHSTTQETLHRSHPLPTQPSLAYRSTHHPTSASSSFPLPVSAPISPRSLPLSLLSHHPTLPLPSPHHRTISPS